MLVWQNKCPNNKKEIYNNKYKHTRDRLFDLSSPKTENNKFHYIPLVFL